PETIERGSGIGMAQHAPMREDGREIVEREHGAHARKRERVVSLYGMDRGMGMRAAHECRMQHAGNGDIVDEAALARQERPVLEPGNALADQRRHGSIPPQPKSDISDLGHLKVPNSGKPEFGWGGWPAQASIRSLRTLGCVRSAGGRVGSLR